MDEVWRLRRSVRRIGALVVILLSVGVVELARLTDGDGVLSVVVPLAGLLVGVGILASETVALRDGTDEGSRGPDGDQGGAVGETAREGGEQ